MKQSRATIFAISALGLLLSLVQGAPLYAQNQSQPPPAACPLEGPSIADTLKYINDALAAAGDQNTDPNGFRFERRSLVLTQDQLTIRWHTVSLKDGQPDNSTPFWEAYSFQVYSLDCTVRVSQYGTYYSIVSNCSNGMPCGTESVETDSGGERNIRPEARESLAFSVGIDSERAERLARALSHLIALLQQQYKQSHSDPNDPFAKPQ
jgi:hypothetical protein